MVKERRQYENQDGLLVLPGTNQCAGYIVNFAEHGAFQPIGKVETTQGPTQAEIDVHNRLLAKAELDHAIEVGRATFYLTYDRPICTPDNPRWRQENAGTWHYSNYRVSNWIGSWKSPHCYVRRGYSYGFGRFETFWVWFTGPDGKQWYGVLKGNMQCFNAKRLKGGKHELSNDVQTANGDNRRTDYETGTRQQGTTGERAQPVCKDATEGQSVRGLAKP